MLPGSSPNILLAEDNPVNQKMALIMLRKLGLRADTASSGQQVLTALEEQPYDLVLMDIEMPEMDGIEATKLIRERWSLGPKIIMLTSLEPELCRDICYNAGADDFINKPVRIDELDAAIARSLSGQSAALASQSQVASLV
jgi:CheY-like chemotaxis protein